ncbi:MAG: hypothetical protein ACK44E_06960 [Anaerolineales bacterium]
MDTLPAKPIKLLVMSFLLYFLLACNLISGLLQDVEGIKSTAASIATEAKGGQEALSTAQAIATQLASSHFIETARAVATDVHQAGAVETLQALVTQPVPGLNETLQSFLTQEAPSLEETAKALLTQVPPLPPSPPEDIPIIGGKKGNLVVSKGTVSYTVAVPYPEVVSFYKAEMPQKGWLFQAATSQELKNSSILNYTKDNRLASVSIIFNPADQKTVVMIVIQNP